MKQAGLQEIDPGSTRWFWPAEGPIDFRTDAVKDKPACSRLTVLKLALIEGWCPITRASLGLHVAVGGYFPLAGCAVACAPFAAAGGPKYSAVQPASSLKRCSVE